MKRLVVVLGILVGLMIPVAAQASASGLNLNWDNIAGSQCKNGSEKLLVNVSYTLTNDYDSGFAGNAWANDTINRNLRIWKSRLDLLRADVRSRDVLDLRRHEPVRDGACERGRHG